MIYYNEDFLEIKWDGNIDTVIMTWKAYVMGDLFRLGLNKGLELIELQKTGRWLADLRKMENLTIEDQEWSSNDWFPRAVKGGVRKMAIIIPENTMANMALKNIMNNVEGIDIETKYFSSFEEAYQWISI